METIGQRIRRIRKSLGIEKQGDLAVRVGITQSTLSDIESKNKDFSATHLYAFARELGVSNDEIMFGNQGEIVGQSELIRIFASLSPEQRATVLTIVRAIQVVDKANIQAA